MKQFVKFVFASALGSMLVVIVGICLLFSIILGVLAYSRSTTEDKIERNSILHLELKGALIEREEMDNPFKSVWDFRNVYGTDLSTLLTCLERGANDPRIIGAFLEQKDFSCEYASAQEIRQALLRFKEKGKWIIAYDDFLPQNEYYISSVADSIIVNPVGMIELKGLAQMNFYYHSFLEKVGIGVQVAKAGAYKSAVESFVLDSMSEESKEQSISYLNSMWKEVVSDFSTARKIQEWKLDTLANDYQPFHSANSYVKEGMADMVLYRSDVDSLLKEKCGIAQKKPLPWVNMERYAKQQDLSIKGKNKIALLYAVGDIDGFEPVSGIDSRKLCEVIDYLKNDVNTKAVVLRINSPGGSAYGAEQIYHEIDQLKKVKPVVVSMGDYAASGGYYIAASASYIIAQPTTITGSIGAFAIFPNVKELSGKIGISVNTICTNLFSDIPNFSRELNEQEMALLQGEIDEIYKLFIERCASGRRKSVADIDSIAEGRVWSGRQAMNLGLVDTLGSLNDAILKASQLAGLKKWEIEEFPEKRDFISGLLGSVGTSMKMRLGTWAFGEDFQVYNVFQNLKSVKGVQTRLPYGWRVK